MRDPVRDPQVNAPNVPPTVPTPARNVLTVPQMARAAGIVMISFVLTGLLGIVRNAVIGGALGESGALDAYFAANRVSETLFTLVSGGALGSAFIPVFARFLTKDDKTSAWHLAGAVVSLVAVGSLILAVIAGVFADSIVSRLLIPDASAAQQMLTVQLMRVMLATVVIFSVSGLSMAILNAHQRFLVASLAPGMYNIGIIIGALFFVPRFGVFGLAYGTLLGALLHLAVQIPALRLLNGTFHLSLSLNTPGVSEVLRLMAPRVLGLGVVQINFWVNAALTSGMVPGSLAALTFAFGLLFTVLGVLGQSVGTAIFPTLSALSGHDDMDGFRRVLAGSLRGVLFMALPASVGLIVLSSPLVEVIYHHGQWTPQNTTATVWALRFFAVGLAGFALQEVLARAFYALRDTWTPVIVGVSGVILNVALSLILIRVISGAQPGQGPFGGLALANALATLLESAALWFLMSRRLHGLNDQVVIGAAARMALAALVMGGSVWALRAALVGFSPLIVLIAGTALGAALYEGITVGLRLTEASSVPRTVIRRFRR